MDEIEEQWKWKSIGLGFKIAEERIEDAVAAIANSLHPGVINTNLARNGGFFDRRTMEMEEYWSRLQDCKRAY
nr:hypothetical protein [Tanacetum cinerariifolium]